MIAREEAWRLMKKRLAPTLAVLLVGLWVVLVGQGAEDLAELCVTKIVLDPPSMIDRGEVVELRARVMNTGSRSADGFDISFYYRLQSSVGNWVLHSTIEGATLPPSHQDFREVTFFLDTMDMELGTYDLRVAADSTNCISETDELNNELLTTMTLREASRGLPDLQPVSLSYAHTNPGTADDMEPWNVITQVRNLGDVQAGTFVVSFLVDGEKFAEQIRFVLPAGGVTDVIAELDPTQLALQPGTHRISVAVDPDDEVLEQNEGNNAILGSLTLQSVELVPLSLVFDRSLVRLDEEVGISTEIRNDGEGVAKDVEISFFAGHVRFATGKIDILGRGMSAAVHATLNPSKAGLSDAPAPYQIRVVVDPNDLLHEFDETNNELSRTLEILPPAVKQPELHPESIELVPPSPAEQGAAQAVTVSSVIRNTGLAEASGFGVVFTYRVKGGMRWEEFLCDEGSACAVPSLAAGAQMKLIGRLPLDVLGAGIYEVRVVVDAGGDVSEIDETNNELVTTVTVLASRLPDLTFCSGGVTMDASASVQRGQTVHLTACITNLGEQDAPAFAVRFSYCAAAATGSSSAGWCAGVDQQSHLAPRAEFAVAGLAIGETVEIPVMLETKDLEPGNYNLRVDIDPLGVVPEREEQNNTFAGIPLAVLGPDLAVVQLLTSPEEVVDRAVADELTVTATILNLGVVPAGEFTVRFRLFHVGEQGMVPIAVALCGASASSTCEPADYSCAETLSGIGVLVPIQVRWTLDLVETDLGPGQYVLRVEADCEGDTDGNGVCDGRIAEHNELNNMLELPLAVLPRPADLVVAGPIEFPDGTPVEYGSLVPIRASIANLGGSTATGSCATSPSCGIGVEFLVYASGSQPGTGERVVRLSPIDSIPSLGPGEAVDVIALLDTNALDPVVTTYRICVRVDPAGSIPELDESNNELCTPPQMELYPPPPDLRFAAGGVAEPVVRFEPVPPVPYAAQPVKALFSVINDSRSASAGFNVGFRLRETSVPGAPWIELPGKLAVGSMGPGETRQLSMQILLPSAQGAAGGDEGPARGFIPAGAYEFCIDLDVDGFVDETDESNNTLCTSLGLIIVDGAPTGTTCSGCADLRIQTISAQMMTGGTSMARVCATIQNVGAADAGVFTVRAYFVPRYGADPVLIEDRKHRVRYAGVPVGETETFRQDFDASGYESGLYDVFVVVDVDNEVPEADESNNRKEETLWIH